MSQSEMTSVLREPLEVEFAHAGEWHRGVLLGWREDEAGRCWMRLQCLVGGLRRTTWMPLADLRLPGPAPAEDATTRLSRHRRPAPALHPRIVAVHLDGRTPAPA
jgi:hypothetical protein